jgi:hypothetical protein
LTNLPADALLADFSLELSFIRSLWGLQNRCDTFCGYVHTNGKPVSMIAVTPCTMLLCFAKTPDKESNLISRIQNDGIRKTSRDVGARADFFRRGHGGRVRFHDLNKEYESAKSVARNWGKILPVGLGSL